ncbi:MAG: proline--tRNA ligase [Candidatus Nanoarchaeia archaeon]
MAAKKFGITTKKADNFSEWYSQLCGEEGAQLVDQRYGIQGFVVYREWGFALLRRLYELLEEAVEADGHEAFMFPVVIPKAYLEKEEEHAGFTPEVFWLTKGGDTDLAEPYAMRPTGETQLYPMYSLWIRSHNDLPYKRYQTRHMCYRNDSGTRPFLRGREFCFFETHDVFATHEEAMEQINTDMKIMEDVVWKQLKVPFIFFRRPKWDAFLGANYTYASDSLVPDGKRLQVSSTHDLGHNFAKAFDVTFKDKNNKEQFGYQTCFGPGIIRIIAALIAIHGDDNGLILPSTMAPVKAVIVPITFSKDKEKTEKVLKTCESLQAQLKKAGLKVVFDTTADESPGFKYNKWELKGVPVRIEVGPKEVEQGKSTMVARVDGKKNPVANKDLAKAIFKSLEEQDQIIEEKAKQYFANNTREATTLDEIKKIMKEHRGFIKIPWCDVTATGEECADILKAETNGAYVTGEAYVKPEKPKAGAKCPVCSKAAKHVVYVCKSY